LFRKEPFTNFKTIDLEWSADPSNFNNCICSCDTFADYTSLYVICGAMERDDKKYQATFIVRFARGAAT